MDTKVTLGAVEACFERLLRAAFARGEAPVSVMPLLVHVEDELGSLPPNYRLRALMNLMDRGVCQWDRSLRLVPPTPR